MAKKTANKDVAAATKEPKTLKKPGRKPMTEAQKAAAAKQREAQKKAAENMKPELILQYQNCETDVMALVEAAKADFKASHKRVLITGLKLYLKPEDGVAYYVINENESGKIPM